MRLFVNIFLLLVLLVPSTFARKISATDARLIARSVLASGYTHQLCSLDENSDPIAIESSGIPLIYVVRLQPRGFVLVSADDASYPVIGFSTESNYSELNQPANFSEWIKGYSDQILYGIQHNVQPDSKITSAWQAYLSGQSTVTRSATSEVEPLLTSTWDQGFPYNYLCPEDPAGSGGHVWAGCVATAMSQVLNYWRWPLQGTGSHGYYSDYGYLWANYGETSYKWEEMTNSASGMNFQMAQLQSHLGISVDMMYSPDGSGAYSQDAANSLIQYFGMNPGLYMANAPDPIDDNWKSLIRSELDAGRPLYYHGFGSAGHAFNLDGYQSPDYFHFNWGWSGSFNGYYYLDNLNPGGYTFNEGQGAIVGISPAGNYPYYCNSTDTLTTLVGTIEDGSGPVGQYLGNTHCGWLIAPADSVSSIKLTFNKFDLKPNVDFLTIYDGCDTSKSVLGTYTGSNLPATITSTGSKMFIKFTSASSSSAGGFLASFSSSKVIFCSGTTVLTAPEGSVSDGSGPRNYRDNTFCKFRIMPDSANSIALTFDEFNTFDQEDYFSIYNLETGELIYKLYGLQNPGTLFCNTSKLLLMFHSNGSDNASGWSFHYNSAYITGIDKPSSLLTSIYPDPADQLLNIHLVNAQASRYTIELLSVTGNCAGKLSGYTGNGEILTQMDVSGLADGIYLLRVSTQDGLMSKKIIIRH